MEEPQQESVSGDKSAKDHSQTTSKKRQRYKLKDNEELVDIVLIDGKKKKKIIRRSKIWKKLSVEEVHEIDTIFRTFDKDQSGNIDSMELKDAMSALGIYVTKESLKKLMEKADKDGSGTIEEKEFQSLMAELITMRDIKWEVEKAYRMYDEEDIGAIDLKNLQKVKMDLGF